MSELPYVDHVLASYFAIDNGASDSEAALQRRQKLKSSPQFEALPRDDVKRAFVDRSLSWRELLVQHDVLCVESEAEARKYAEQLFEKVFAPEQNRPPSSNQ